MAGELEYYGRMYAPSKEEAMKTLIVLCIFIFRRCGYREPSFLLMTRLSQPSGYLEGSFVHVTGMKRTSDHEVATVKAGSSCDHGRINARLDRVEQSTSGSTRIALPASRSHSSSFTL
jgi:hypothetical protein